MSGTFARWMLLGISSMVPFFCPAQDKQAGPSKIVATVDGKPIAAQELDKAAAGELERLEMQKLQFEAQYVRSRQQILEANLARLIDARLLALEAERRGISEEALLEREVDAKVKRTTHEDVEAYYKANQARIGRPMEQVATQIKDYLEQQASASARSDFFKELKKRYSTESLLEPLRVQVESAGHPSRGPADAPVTIVEFSDFQCTYCKTLSETLAEVQKNYPRDVRLVFRQFPLKAIHHDAMKAAEASLCAEEQDRFWALHDAMFASQSALSAGDLKDKAAELKLDAAAFSQCLDSGRFAGAIQQDLLDGARAGVTGTPVIFINGRFLSGVQPYEEIARIIDEELRRKETARR